MSETQYIKELEDNLTDALLKIAFYEKHFKHLVCHHGYNEGNYCPHVATERLCYFCNLPYCTINDHCTTCEKCYHIVCQNCSPTHNCCDHTNLSDEWGNGCHECSEPACSQCISSHSCDHTDLSDECNNRCHECGTSF